MRSVDMGDVVKHVYNARASPDAGLPAASFATTGQMQQARETAQAASGQLAQAQAAALKAEQDFARADTLYKKTSLTRSD